MICSHCKKETDEYLCITSQHCGECYLYFLSLRKEKKMKNCEDIIKDYLKGNGFQGLVNPYCECGCCTDEMDPAGCISLECQAAYRHECKGCKKSGDCWLEVEYDGTGCFRTEKEVD